MEIPNNSIAPIPSNLEKTTAHSPETVTTDLEGFFQGSNASSPPNLIKRVETSQTTKSILKNKSAYSSHGKVSAGLTNFKKGSIQFDQQTKTHDGGERHKKISPSNAPNEISQTGRARSSSATPPPYSPRKASQKYLPEEYSKGDDDFDRMAKKASDIIVGNLRKVATAVSDFVKAPEDFFIPKQPTEKSQAPKAPKNQNH